MNKFGKLVLSCLVIVALLAIIFGFTSSGSKVDKDGRVEVDLKYEVGSLNTTGKYAEAEDKLYTKTAFKCKGLTVKLDFDANVEYQIFFYDEDEYYISSTEKLDASYNDEVPENAVYARIVIYPEFGSDVSEPSITIFNKGDYTKQLLVKVYNNQEKDVEATE